MNCKKLSFYLFLLVNLPFTLLAVDDSDIFIDAVFTPIKNFKYCIEDFIVEQKTDYEKLVLEIITDGSIEPKDALTEGEKVLINHFMLFSDERITL